MLNLLKNKNFRNWGIGAIVVIALVWIGVNFSSASASASTAAAEAKVVTLNTAETIEASGSLETQPFAALDWKTSGVVAAVNVNPGDFVKAGDILLTLQPSSTSASIASAQADLVTAQKNLDDLLNSDTDRAQAAIDLKDAQEEYDNAVRYLNYLKYNNKIPLTDAKVYLVKTPSGWKYDYSHVKSYKGPATENMLTDAVNDLALDKSCLEDAQREYDRLKHGPNPQDVLAAHAKLDAAQATVNSLSIIAPFDGQVLSVDDHVGDTISVGELSTNMADLNHLYVELQVDESDIAKVKLGNQVEITLDAVSGITPTGKVTAINPVGVDISGLVKYKVRVDLDKAKDQPFLPLGTTANVVITVKDASSNLAVPIAAIQNDAKGEYVWVIQSDGSAKRIDVVSGTIVGDKVIVTGDLKEGNGIQLVHESSFKAPNPFGGGN